MSDQKNCSLKGRFLNFSEEAMKLAIENVQRGMPMAAASKNHKVPRTTLMDKVKGKTTKERKMGRNSYLSKEEESILVSWIIRMSRCGFPIRKDQLLDSVQRLIKELPRENPFTNDRPANGWYKSFLKSNPQMSTRNPQNLTITKAYVTEVQLNSWFK